MYTLCQPAAALAPYIESYWCVRARPGVPFDLTVDVYVDARADLVFNFGVGYARALVGGDARVVGASNLDAQRRHPITISQKGQVVITGVRFHTAGLAAFVSTSVHAWTDRVVPVAAAFGDGVRAVEDALRSAGDDIAVHRQILDGFFASRLRMTRAKETLHALKRQVERDGGRGRIEELCDAGSISIRQVDRLFRSHLGFGPKTFARIVRFQAALTRLKGDPGCTLAAVAAECGYYDQPHFVREFKQYAGTAPRSKVGYFPDGAPADFSPNLVQFVQDWQPGAGQGRAPNAKERTP